MISLGFLKTLQCVFNTECGNLSKGSISHSCFSILTKNWSHKWQHRFVEAVNIKTDQLLLSFLFFSFYKSLVFIGSTRHYSFQITIYIHVLLLLNRHDPLTFHNLCNMIKKKKNAISLFLWQQALETGKWSSAGLTLNNLMWTELYL